MLHFLVTLQNLVTDRVESTKDRGATAVEYGLMVALIAAVIVVAVAAIGTRLNTQFEFVRDQLPTN